MSDSYVDRLMENEYALPAASGAAAGALPLMGFAGVKNLPLQDAKIFKSTRDLSNAAKPGDVLTLGGSKLSLPKAFVSLGMGTPGAYHTAIVESVRKDGAIVILDMTPEAGYSRRVIPVGTSAHLVLQRPKSGGASIVSNFQKLLDIQTRVEKALIQKGVPADIARQTMLKSYGGAPMMIEHGLRELFTTGEVTVDPKVQYKTYAAEIDALHKNPEALTKTLFNKLQSGERINYQDFGCVGGVCTDASAKSGVPVSEGTTLRRATPRDVLSSPELKTLGKRIGPSHSYVDSLLRHGPKAVRIGAGLGLGAMGYYGAKALQDDESLVDEWVGKFSEHVTKEEIHRLADKAKIQWDDDPDFLAWSKKVTGKSYLDDMTLEQLGKMKEAILEKTSSEGLYRPRATIITRDPETGHLLAGYDDSKQFSQVPHHYFPGGGVFEDEGVTRVPTDEEVMAGARREALEELGFELDNPRLIGSNRYTLPEKWQKKTMEMRGIPYKGVHQYYILADRGKKNESLYGSEGDAFSQGKYFPVEDIVASMQASPEGDPFNEFKRYQADLLREHLLKTAADKFSEYTGHLEKRIKERGGKGSRANARKLKKALKNMGRGSLPKTISVRMPRPGGQDVFIAEHMSSKPGTAPSWRVKTLYRPGWSSSDAKSMLFFELKGYSDKLDSRKKTAADEYTPGQLAAAAGGASLLAVPAAIQPYLGKEVLRYEAGKPVVILHTTSERGAGHAEQARNIEKAFKSRGIPVQVIDVERQFAKSPEGFAKYVKDYGDVVAGRRSHTSWAADFARYHMTGIDRKALSKAIDGAGAVITTSSSLRPFIPDTNKSINVVFSDVSQKLPYFEGGALRSTDVRFTADPDLAKRYPSNTRVMSNVPIDPSLFGGRAPTGILNPDRFNVTISGGGLGVDVGKMTRELLKSEAREVAGKPITFHAITAGMQSNNPAKYTALKELAEKHPERLVLHDRVPLAQLLAESDMNVLRPSGTTVTEAIMGKKPMLQVVRGGMDERGNPRLLDSMNTRNAIAARAQTNAPIASLGGREYAPDISSKFDKFLSNLELHQRGVGSAADKFVDTAGGIAEDVIRRPTMWAPGRIPLAKPLAIAGGLGALGLGAVSLRDYLSES